MELKKKNKNKSCPFSPLFSRPLIFFASKKKSYQTFFFPKQGSAYVTKHSQSHQVSDPFQRPEKTQIARVNPQGLLWEMISRPVTASCSPEMMGFRIYKGIPPKMRKPFRFRNYSNLPSWIEVMFISAKVFLVGARNVPKFKRSISWDMRSFRLPVSQEWLSMLVFIWRQHLQSNM